MRFTLRQLEVFLAVARHESVSRAAEELGMSQSAASGALAELEHQFDVRLFDRLGKRLRLSSLGRELRARAETVHEQARELEQAFTNPASLGPLAVGATLTIGNYLVPSVLAKYMARFPESQVSFSIGNTREIVGRVENFELDVGLIEGELASEVLQVTPWCEDELAVFCAPDHPWARAREITDRELCGERWIVRESGSGTRQAFERAMAGVLPDLRIALELEHTEAIKGAVGAGLGVGCVSRLALEREFAQGTLVRCPVAHRSFRRRFYFVVHGRKHLTEPLRRWLELCRSEVPG